MVAYVSLLVLDNQLKILSVNKSFYDTFKLKKSTTGGEKLYEIGECDWNIHSIQNLLLDMIKENKKIKDFEFDHTFNKVGHK
jgi:two-component system CheB/CheR fusion protein